MLKRGIDLLLASAALVLTAPVLAGVAVAVRVRLGAPVFFKQIRPGLHAQPFTLVKFRTMTDARGPDGALLPDAQRLPAFGRWLRATSLDELPSLWNVVRGEMSLVGPRPLLMEYLPLYTPEQARRHEVRPGLTGWAQIHGRNRQSWPDRLRLDVWYVDHQSVGLDLRIMIRTLRQLARTRDTHAVGHATMPRLRLSDG